MNDGAQNTRTLRAKVFLMLINSFSRGLEPNRTGYLFTVAPAQHSSDAGCNYTPEWQPLGTGGWTGRLRCCETDTIGDPLGA